MAQLTTTYDKELNQKVFKLRGDEGYARNTRVTIADKGSEHYDEDIESFDMVLTVTVLNSAGVSNLVIYDGDRSIQIVDWSSSNTTQDITVTGMTYDVNHKLSVKFLGNNQCLKSTSNTIELNVVNTHKHSIKLVATTSSGAYSIRGDNTTVKCQIYDTSDDEDVLVEDGHCTVKLYLDGIYKGSQTIRTSGDNQGWAVFSNTTYLKGMTSGLHEVRFVFDGYATNESTPTYYNKSSTSFILSVGSLITITSKPKIWVNGVNNDLWATVTDYNGNLFGSGIGLTFSSSEGRTATSNISNGRAEFSNITTIENGVSYYVYDTSYPTLGVSEEFVANACTITSITMTTNATMVTPNSTATITVQLNGDNIQSGIPVTITGNSGLNGTEYRTDEFGRVSLKYTGNTSHDGDITITATAGNVSESITIENLLFAYGITGVPNYNPLKIFKGTISYLSEGIKFNLPNNYNYVVIGLGNATDEIGDYILSFDTVGEEVRLFYNFGAWNENGENWSSPHDADQWLTFWRNGKIRVVKQNNTAQTYRQGKTYYDGSSWESSSAHKMTFTVDSQRVNHYPTIFLGYRKDDSSQQGKKVILNNIKLKKI